MPNSPTTFASEQPTASVRARGFFELAKTLFERIFANTPELISEAHRLRYQVYCIERRFEDPARNSDGLERDEYDNHSLHGILRHRASGMAIGTVRWVLHKAGAGLHSFPLHEACEDSCMQSGDFLPLEKTAELSRFAISKAFRRRTGDGVYGDAEEIDGSDVNRRPDTPIIVLHLMAVAVQIAVGRGIEYGMAAMEPKLLRLLGRFGMKFESLGPLVRYHGWRQPCYAHLPTFLAHIERERPEIWDVMTERGKVWSSSTTTPSLPAYAVSAMVETSCFTHHQNCEKDAVAPLPAVA